MRCEDGDFVPACLQTNRGIDDQPLRAADAQVRVEEDDALHLLSHVVCVQALNALRNVLRRRVVGLSFRVLAAEAPATSSEG